MKIRDVLVLGAGIAGCSVALALAKKGVNVAILTSSLDQRIYHSTFVQHDDLEAKLKSLQVGPLPDLCCNRAADQLINHSKRCVNELLEPHYLVDRNGNIDIHRCLQEQLNQLPNVEWLLNCSLIELMTLHQHSAKNNDAYKSPTCIGAVICHQSSLEVEMILAKETVLATGGGCSLYSFSTHHPMVRGEGFAIAEKAGARLLNVGEFEFYPLGLFNKNKPSYPIPLELLSLGAAIVSTPGTAPLEFTEEEPLSQQIYQQISAHKQEYLWLDLTSLDFVRIKDQFPALEAHCMGLGYNIAKDLLPIIPVACYSCGGVAVDKCGQTNLHRLRAVGEVSCTGLIYDFKDETLSILESLTWAIGCADDILKFLPKFVYYFPDIKKESIPLLEKTPIIEEDWMILKQIMWRYVGIKRDTPRLERGKRLIQDLISFIEEEKSHHCSLELIHLANALHASALICQDAYRKKLSFSRTKAKNKEVKI